MVINSNRSDGVKSKNKMNVPPEIIEQIKDKNMTLADGTDISFITDPVFRHNIQPLTLVQLRQHKQAYEAAKEYYDLSQNNVGYRILSGDYVLPDTDSNVIWGYIIQVRYREDKAREYLYLDICIGDKDLKTIRCELSKFSDPVRSAISEKFGWQYNIEDLLFILIRVKYINKKDENGKTYFSVIEHVYIDTNDTMLPCLDKAYEMLIGE